MNPERSLYMPTQPSASESSGERSLEDNTTERGRPLEALNKYLRSHSKRPIRSQLSIPWQMQAKEARDITFARELLLCRILHLMILLSFFKRCHLPESYGALFYALIKIPIAILCWMKHWWMPSLSVIMLRIPGSQEDRSFQSFKQLQRWIPDLTKHRFTEAKRHCQVHGRGAPIQQDTLPRMRVPTAKIDHVVAFITSNHVLQDLPFGERTVTLSTKETIKVPNVIRTLLPERIVKQYGSYC